MISGTISIDGSPAPFATVTIDSTSFATTTNHMGRFSIGGVPYGQYVLSVSYVGYESIHQEIDLTEQNRSLDLNIVLSEHALDLDAIVVTGTKTFKRKTSSPVIVHVLNNESLDRVQACNLSEGLRFQPGLRVETDCQTCNYTQLRMNGLSGGYSQVLINGRPIFSPLTGLYGLEQLPTHMVERIEVVSGGGSSLYGSSAVGGTVNVITKTPKRNGYEFGYSYHNLDGQTDDHLLTGNATLVSAQKDLGATLFMNYRDRGFYDANGDHFSELPMIENAAVGISAFFLPTDDQKLELSLSHLYEYRFGGEMNTSVPAHLTQQSEERTHRVVMLSSDYQLNFNNNNSSLIAYAAWQHADRDHYTGILPDIGEGIRDDFLTHPPYGNSAVQTFNVGTQLNHRLVNFIRGDNVLTFGLEYIYDDVYDEIPAYGYLIDQTTRDLGILFQSDWQISPQFTLLSGIRLDKHNLIDEPVLSPRLSLLYKQGAYSQFRMSYGSGFRAPQAFDADLHIAFAGGGISRVILSPDLKQESSHSYSASFNFDKPKDDFVYGFTIEGFYTRLSDAFYLDPIGEDEFGEVFEKRNGQGAKVQGLTIELRANAKSKLQLESGLTIQSSRFDEKVKYIDEVDGTRDFMRTPNVYGFALLSYAPNSKWQSTLNYVYTGSMYVPHFAGAPNQSIDEITQSDAFSELGIKLSYTIPLKSVGNNIEFYGGIKNIFDAYQDDFDIGKNRDSNYIYGPAQPRSFFVGIKLFR